MQSGLLAAITAGASAPRCPIRPRAPLPPFPPGVYDNTLPFTPPATPDRLFYRGNFSGIWVPDSPKIPDGYNWTLPNAPAGLIWSPDLWKYPPEWQRTILCDYATRGYTHYLWQWNPALTFDQYVALARLIKEYVPFCDCWFLAKNYEPRDAPGSYYQQKYQELINKLLAAKAVDTACVAFEFDLFNGVESQSVIDVFANWFAPHDIPLMIHFSTERTWWGDYPDRFAFWQAQAGKLRGIHYQGDVQWTMGELQARMVDTMNPFGDGRMGQFSPGQNYLFVPAEISAMKAFFTPYDTEDLQDQWGYLSNCTRANVYSSGYYNGGRMPNGTVL